MGDVGRGFYVKPDIPEIFKNEVIALADIVTPNQFELEALTGIKTETIEDVRRAIETLHGKGPRVVLVTSYRSRESPAGDGGARIGMLVSDSTGLYHIHTPELPLGAGMAGSGDLTASVFLSRYLEKGEVKPALELATASVFGILEAASRAGNLDSSRLPELPLIQAQKELDAPSHVFQARKL
jgi:pyridoxine kinase